jgi:TRAP transporter 4TM/12TM fusion protein
LVEEEMAGTDPGGSQEGTQYVGERITRKLTGAGGLICTTVAILFSVFELWSNSYGIMLSMLQGGVFLAFLLFLIFLLYPARKGSPRDRIPITDWILACLGVSGGFYTYFTFETFARRNLVANELDYLFAALTILLVLEATRRAVGIWLSLISIVFLIYAYFGPYFPGVFAHGGFSLERILLRMYLVDEGLYGITSKVAATYIYLFVLFGAFLSASGTAAFFNQLAIACSGKAAGGPAKVAVISSAIMGTISGSAVANVATTGTFTIPLMKRVGYRSSFAGAVEAAASTGGMIMPPVMGAAAFVMAEFLGISYLKIMIAAIIPALLYYLAVFSGVHIEAIRSGLERIPPEELPKIKDVLLSRGQLLVPIGVVVAVLLTGRTPIFAAFMGIVTTFVVSQIRKGTRMGPRALLSALETGGRSSLSVGIACIVVGIVVGIVSMTGVGQMLTYNIMKLSLGILFLALLFTLVASLFLSMGLPATACYIIVATVCAPALVRMGVPDIAAHMFVFYFGCLSNLTPPVCLASYTAAGIAGSKPSEVAIMGLRLTMAGFIIPFMFVYSPQLLLQNVQFPAILLVIATAIVGVVTLSISERGYWMGQMGLFERLALLLASLLMIKPGSLTDAIGLGLLLAVFFIRRYGGKRSQIQAIH